MQEVPDKEGQLKKRGGRMHQWSSRYFMLTGSNLSYKTKQDSTTLRGSFDLVPGCVLTEVVEETTITGKKMYNFWIVWPHDKTKRVEDYKPSEESDDEKEEEEKIVGGKAKDLQKIVETEVMTQKRQKDAAEEQIDKHHAHDSNVSLGMKVAAVAVGGVVVGALTAGIGLVPYMTVVGITAAAGGGAVAMQFRGRPQDSRIIIACDSMAEALDWKTAIERQINRLEGSLKPMLPSSVDPKLISSIIDKGILGGAWKRVAIYEGMRIMEHISAGNKALKHVHPWVNDNDSAFDKCMRESTVGTESASVVTSRCCKAQMAVRSSPINSFLNIMNASNWPQRGSLKVIKEVDDHADLVGVELVYDCSIRNGGGHKRVTRRMCFSRFWKLEDDGVYLITLNSRKSDEFPGSVLEGKKVAKNTTEPSVDAVITIAPRHDAASYEYEVQESMVTCVCQTSLEGNWQRGEQTAFMEAFLKDHLLELGQSLLNSRFVSLADRPPVPAAIKLATSMDEYGLPYDTAAAAQRAPSALNAHRLNRRGITTVQPGLEDATSDAYNHTAISNSHGESPYETDQIIAGGGGSSSSSVAVSIPPYDNRHGSQQSSPTEKKKKSLFSRVAGTSKNKTTDTVPDKRAVTPPRAPLNRAFSASSDEGLRQASPPTQKASGTSTGSIMPANESAKGSSPVKPSKKRDKRTNAEATLLRNQMLATEYELTRLAKSMRKKTVVPATSPGQPAAKHDKHHITQEEYAVLQSQQNEQQLKLQNLRNKYTNLTGEVYVAPKSTFSRLRTFGRGNSVPISSTHLVAGDQSVSTVRTSAGAANTSPNGGVAEGSSFIFHTDGKSLKGATSSSSFSGKSGGGGGSNKKEIPANCLRPSHWAVSRSPGMRMDADLLASSSSSNGWTSLFTEPQEGSSAAAVRSKNILIIALCTAYMLLCGGIGYFFTHYHEFVTFRFN